MPDEPRREGPGPGDPGPGDLGPGEFRPGERVRWTEHGRWFSGRVVRRVTHDLVLKGHGLPASPAAPRWLVVTAAGDHAAHPAEAIRRVDGAEVRQGELFAPPPVGAPPPERA